MEKVNSRPDRRTEVPTVEKLVIVNYLVLTTSFYTGKQFKAYINLNSYKCFVAGWVHAVRIWKICNTSNYVVYPRVCHTMSFATRPRFTLVSEINYEAFI